MRCSASIGLFALPYARYLSQFTQSHVQLVYLPFLVCCNWWLDEYKRPSVHRPLWTAAVFRVSTYFFGNQLTSQNGHSIFFVSIFDFLFDLVCEICKTASFKNLVTVC